MKYSPSIFSIILLLLLQISPCWAWPSEDEKGAMQQANAKRDAESRDEVQSRDEIIADRNEGEGNILQPEFSGTSPAQTHSDAATQTDGILRAAAREALQEMETKISNLFCVSDVKRKRREAIQALFPELRERVMMAERQAMDSGEADIFLKDLESYLLIKRGGSEHAAVSISCLTVPMAVLLLQQRSMVNEGSQNLPIESSLVQLKSHEKSLRAYCDPFLNPNKYKPHVEDDSYPNSLNYRSENVHEKTMLPLQECLTELCQPRVSQDIQLSLLYWRAVAAYSQAEKNYLGSFKTKSTFQSDCMEFNNYEKGDKFSKDKLFVSNQLSFHEAEALRHSALAMASGNNELAQSWEGLSTKYQESLNEMNGYDSYTKKYKPGTWSLLTGSYKTNPFNITDVPGYGRRLIEEECLLKEEQDISARETGVSSQD